MEEANIKKQILQKMKILMDSFEEGDITRIHELYAEDCVVMRTGSTFVKNEGVPAVFQHLWNDGVRHIFMQNDSMMIREDVVIDRSHYILMTDGGTVYETGKALTVWAKREDEWYIYNDMWNEGYEKNQLQTKILGD